MYRSTQLSRQVRIVFPLLALRGLDGGRAGNASASSVLFSLHPESRIQIRKVPNYFFCSLAVACRIGNFFFFLLSPQSLPILKQFSTFLPYSLPLVLLRYYIRASTDYLLLLSARSRSHALPRPAVTRTTLLSRLHQALPKPAGKRKSICASQLYIPRFSR